MTELTDLPLTSITLSLFALSAAVDQRADVDVEAVRTRARDHTLIDWLADGGLGAGSWSHLAASARTMDTRSHLTVLFDNLVGDGWGRSRDPRSSGVALLIFLFTEALQQREPQQ